VGQPRDRRFVGRRVHSFARKHPKSAKTSSSRGVLQGCNGIAVVDDRAQVTKGSSQFADAAAAERRYAFGPTRAWLNPRALIGRVWLRNWAQSDPSRTAPEANEAERPRSVLWLLRPWSAMLPCRELFSTAGDLQVRRSAVELLRVVADRRVVPWVPTFLADPDPGIQRWGMPASPPCYRAWMSCSGACLANFGLHGPTELPPAQLARHKTMA